MIIYFAIYLISSDTEKIEPCPLIVQNYISGGANTDDDLFSDEDEDMPAICEGKGRKNKSNSDQDTTKVFLNFSR